MKSLCLFFVVFFMASSLYAEGELEKFNKKSSAITFTENKGQVSDQNYNPRPDVLFSGEANGMVFHLRKNGISYQINRVDSWKEKEQIEALYDLEKRKTPDQVTIYRTDVNWLGTNRQVEIQKGEPLAGYKNFYLTSCPDGVTDVHSFVDLTYKNIYPGIDLKLYDNKGELEYDFIVSPGTDYKQIKWAIKGATSLSINEEGDLLVVTPLGILREQAPMAFQGRDTLESSWIVRGNEIGFVVHGNDESKTLIIDPIVRLWGTYYGGTGIEQGRAITNDASSVYMTGNTESTSSIATTGAHQISLNSQMDAFLIKFDSSSGARIWGTYYGGNYDDDSYSCTSDGSNIYVSGYTESTTGGIASAGAHQTSYAGGSYDAFLVKFNSSGVRQWGTYFGGPGRDQSYTCLSVGSDIYISGLTESTTLIATAGVHQPSYAGGMDAFLIRFNSSGVRQWGTYFGGGGGHERGHSIASDGTNIYLAGYTASNTGISTPGAHQTSRTSHNDAFLVKFSSSGIRLWGTYYGGAWDDYGLGCASDGSNIYLTGQTQSSDAIGTVGSHQPTYGGGLMDGFLVKFNSSGQRQWGTYYGGTDTDRFWTCAVEGSNVYATGLTWSSNGIASSTAYQTGFGGGYDVMLAKFRGSGKRIWGTYYGGSDADEPFSCLTDGSNMYISGETRSTTAISSMGAHQVSGGGNYDAFLVKFKGCTAATYTAISEIACDSLVSPSGCYTWDSSGVYNDTLSNSRGCDSIITINLTVNKSPTITPGWIEGRCDPGTLNLPVNTSGGIVYWYDSLISTQPLDTGNIFQTPFLDSTTVFYAEAIDNGCVSNRISITAFVWYSDSIFIDTTVCISYMAPDSSIRNTTGIYIVTLQKQQGCDSVFTIDLTVIPVETGVSIQNNLLTSGATSGTYQWIDCSSKSPLNGEINQSFTPTSNGSYAVVVSQNGCTDTSICIEVTWVGIESSTPNPIHIYPNPTTDVLTIDLGEMQSEVTLILRNDLGQVVIEKTIYNVKETSIDLSEFANGMYSLSTQLNKRVIVQNVIKQ